MLEFLRNYTGEIEVNGETIQNQNIAQVLDNLTGNIQIHLKPAENARVRNAFTLKQEAVRDETKVQYNVLVKPWMTQKSNGTFNFMMTWNNDVPMPLRFMRGNVNKETQGMFNMTLHGVAQKTNMCSVCGRTLTNPISRLYGIGPECMQKVGIFADISMEEAEQKLDEINKRIESLTWTGWIAKSAVMEMVEVK